MPRRKRGRDRPRSDKRRNRKQDLPALNVIPFQKIGEPKPSAGEHDRVEPITVPWEQRVQPQPTGKSLENAVGVMYVSRKKAPKIEKVSLKDFEQEFRRGKQVIRRRRASPMLTVCFYDIQRSSYYLEKYRQYKGEIYYAERNGIWCITLADWLTRIDPFETETSARNWAQRYLGRKYFKGEESGA